MSHDYECCIHVEPLQAQDCFSELDIHQGTLFCTYKWIHGAYEYRLAWVDPQPWINNSDQKKTSKTDF